MFPLSGYKFITGDELWVWLYNKSPEQCPGILMVFPVSQSKIKKE